MNNIYASTRINLVSVPICRIILHTIKLMSYFLEMVTCWIAAEHALHHVEKRLSQIETIFQSHDIDKSQYAIYAGFDETLIRTGVGYMEQIHLFTMANIAPESPLLSQLGKVLSPFSSILFTASHTLHLPIYKPGSTTTWGFDELAFKTASKVIDHGSTAAMHPTVISLSQRIDKNNSLGLSSTAASGLGSGSTFDDNDLGIFEDRKGGHSGGSEAGGGNEDTDEVGHSEEHQGHGNGEDSGDDSGDDQIDNNSGGGPGFPGEPSSKGKSAQRSPTIDFEVVSEIFMSQNGKKFQCITTDGTLTLQVYSASLGFYCFYSQTILDGQGSQIHNM
jgi:hypothetical protein